jgi:hypothetical protein
MNSEVIYEFQEQEGTIAKRSGRWMGQLIRLAGVLLLSTAAFAQYGGMGAGTGSSTTPSYGHGKAIGIGVGAAAAGVGAVYLITHRSSKISGCVEPADDGLHLTEDKTNKTLSLVPGNADIKPGERVELKGKIKKNATGDQSFLVKTVAKDFGPCHPGAGAGHANPLNAEAR